MTKNIIILHGWALILNKGWEPFVQKLKDRGYKIYFPKINSCNYIVIYMYDGSNCDRSESFYLL